MSSFRNKILKSEKGFDRVKMKVKDALNLFDPVIIFPYRGFGTGENFFIEGRVLEKEEVIHGEKEHSNSLWNNIRKIWKRYESDEIPGVEIEAEMKGVSAKTISDEEGFFKLTFKTPPGKVIDDGWHEAVLRITNMPFDVEYEETATAQVLITNQQDNFGIISDVDDTIIKSSAMNTFKKLKIMLTQNARNRVAFEGVEKFYQRLTCNGKNPLFFVSGSSWNLYDMLVTFCRHQNIPDAPFFLRNLGLTAEQWLKQDTSPYKKAYITQLLKLYTRMPFILIGDSGQKDPEIYTELNREFPGRIKAIYIRHVHTDKRKAELERMAETIDVPFLVLKDSGNALEHAMRMKWI